MIKNIIVFVLLVNLLVFFFGCAPEKTVSQEEVKKIEVQQEKIEIQEEKAEPEKVVEQKPEPLVIEQKPVEIKVVEPNEPKKEPEVTEKPKEKAVEIKEPAKEIKKEPAKEVKKEVKKAEIKKAEPEPKVTFNHKCGYILRNFVNDKGRVDYTTLRRYHTPLRNLLNEFAKLEPKEYKSWPKEDKMAFWINVYNIQMLDIIRVNYPIKSSRWRRIWYPLNSIQHIEDIWSGYKFIVMDEEFTLSEIDKRFLRKEFNEPRIFFGICNATVSDPPLRNEPYTGKNLYKQLDSQINKFLSDTKNLKIDKEKGTVYLSAVFGPTFYGNEFIDKYGTDKKFKDQPTYLRAILNFITDYISEQDKYFLETSNYTVKYLPYNWRLNDR